MSKLFFTGEIVELDPCVVQLVDIDLSVMSFVLLEGQFLILELRLLMFWFQGLLRQ